MVWDKENRMEYWFPKIPKSIQKPSTKIIMIKPKWTRDGNNMEITEEEFRQIEESSKEFKFPLFMRGSETSGKHDWENICFIKSKEEIRKKVIDLIEDAMLKDIGCSSIILREYIEMDGTFTAFWGKMPVNTERRYFIKDGKVICHHPYWIEDAIKNPSVNNWKELLKIHNEENDQEIKLLTRYAEEISRNFEGYWSVDFCRSKEGVWYCLDMALGQASWHPECSNKIQENI